MSRAGSLAKVGRHPQTLSLGQDYAKLRGCKGSPLLGAEKPGSRSKAEGSLGFTSLALSPNLTPIPQVFLSTLGTRLASPLRWRLWGPGVW